MSNYKISIVLYDPDLCGHDQNASRRVNGRISSHESNVLELFVQFAVFLVAKGLNWCCVYNSLLVSKRHGYSIPKTINYANVFT